MSWLALASLIAVIAAAVRRARGETTTPLDAWVVGSAVAIALIGLGATLLAAAGILEPGPLALLNAGVAAGWWPRSVKRRLVRWPRGTSIAATIVILGGLALRLPVNEFPLGGRDQGTYLLRAQHTARTGRLDATDPVVARVSVDRDRGGPGDIEGLYTRRADPWREDVYEAAYRPGWYLADFETGRITPQFFHLFPSLLAVGELVPLPGGAAGWMPLLALLSLLAMWALARRLFPPALALFALGLYASSPLVIWTHRQTLTEPLFGALFLAVGVAVSVPGPAGSNRRYETAGFLLGALAFVRGDAWILLPVALLMLWCMPEGAVGRRRGPAALVLLLCGSVSLHSLTSFPYVHDEIARQLGGEPTPLRLIVLSGLGALVWWGGDVAFGGRGGTGAVLRRSPLVMGGLLGAAVLTWLTDTGEAFSRLDPLVPMLGWPLLVAAAAGVTLAALFWRPPPTDVWRVTLAAAVVVTFTLYTPHNLPKMGLYYYGRYLVPVLVPAAILAATYTVWKGWGTARWRQVSMVVLMTATAWPAHVLITSPQTRLREFAGAREAMERIADATEPDAVIIAGGEGWHNGHTFNQVGAALAFSHGRTVLPYRTDEAARNALHELLVAGPAAGHPAPPTYLLINEASHPLEEGDLRLSAVDDLLPGPLMVQRVDAFEVVLHRLTPSIDGAPTRVTRDGLRMALMKIGVSPDVGIERWTFEDGISGPRRIEVRPERWENGHLCLHPRRPVRIRLPPGENRHLAVVALPGTSAENGTWKVRIDGQAVPLRLPRQAPRPRDTLGPFARARPPLVLELRGAPIPVPGARCPYGGLQEIRLGPAGRNVPPTRWSAVTLAPANDLGHPPETTRWVRGRGLSRFRPQPDGGAAVAGLSLVLHGGDRLRFGPTELPGAPLAVVTTLTRAAVSGDARLVVRAGEQVVARIDPPNSREQSWQSPPARWTPDADVADLTVELQGEPEDMVHMRDLALFATEQGVTSRLEVVDD